jgi:ribosomal protein S18 acetylase RimI-like enzyme
MNTTLRRASAADAELIAELVNQAYRPTAETAGWTHEAHLIGGPRTTPEQVRTLFCTDSTVLVLCRGSGIVACVHARRDGSAAHIGMLATAAACQGQGLGKQMLYHAEKYAAEVFNVKVFRLSVISQRPELIAFYERRGYMRTGQCAAYPLSAGAGIPLVSDVRIETLEKSSLA